MNVPRPLWATACGVCLFAFVSACGVQPDASAVASSEVIPGHTAPRIGGGTTTHRPLSPPAHRPPRPPARQVDARHLHAVAHVETHLTPHNGRQVRINHQQTGQHGGGQEGGQ